jgi:hypothetical protein
MLQFEFDDNSNCRRFVQWPETVVMNTEQLISNGGRFKLAFAKRDKKPTMVDL